MTTFWYSFSPSNSKSSNEDDPLDPFTKEQNQQMKEIIEFINGKPKGKAEEPKFNDYK